MKALSRLLRLLALLPTRRSWSGPALAEKLGVTTRTVRNDMERLRAVGYVVDSAAGVEGGYRMGPGAKLPPLLLDDDEAIAVAIGLRSLAAGAMVGLEETALRALLKIEQVVPARVRAKIGVLKQAIVATSPFAAPVDVDLLSMLAGACHESRRLRFDYTTSNGATGARTTEPHRVVYDRGRWYLLAWDLQREQWRTFRVDRMRPQPSLGGRFLPREAPAAGAAEHVSREIQRASWDFRARIKVSMSAAEVSARVPSAVAVLPAGPGTSVVSVGSDSPEMLAVYLGMLGADFTVVDAPELHQPLLALAKRYRRAARSAALLDGASRRAR